MIRVSVVVSGRSSAGASMAMTDTSSGANKMPSNTTRVVARASVPKTRRANSNARASPSCSRTSVKVGTNAAARAPSAKKSRRRFGMRKANTNASANRVVANRAAKTASRASPRIREHIVALATSPAGRATDSGAVRSGTGASLPPASDRGASRFMPRRGSIAELGIERVAHAVAHEVERGHREEDRDRRRDDEVPILVLATVLQDAAPRGRGGVSQPEEGQTGLDQDRPRRRRTWPTRERGRWHSATRAGR